MKNKALILFLIANFILAILIGVKFTLNNNSNSKKTSVVNTQPAVAATQIAPIQAPVQPPKSANVAPVCVVYGPMNLEQKATMDALLVSQKTQNSASVYMKNMYEILWNLGKDKEQAEILFNKQKQGGALQDEKFKLTVDENQDWIVSITLIPDSEETAHQLATQLADKANKSKAGGQWQYRTKPSGYFYRFNNINAINVQTQETIAHTINVSKQPCL